MIRKLPAGGYRLYSRKVDPKTGAVKYIKADAANGQAATAHGLVRDGAGNFYVAARGGTNDDGVIVKLTPGSQGLLTETVLHNFTGGNDGISPIALLLDASGNLFGLAGGGANDANVFFELTPTSHGEWNLSVLFNNFNVNNGPAADSVIGKSALVRQAFELAIDRTALAIDGAPVEWRVSLCRTDTVHYLSDLR